MKIGDVDSAPHVLRKHVALKHSSLAWKGICKQCAQISGVPAQVLVEV
jgi:hypothetical protein